MPGAHAAQPAPASREGAVRVERPDPLAGGAVDRPSTSGTRRRCWRPPRAWPWRRVDELEHAALGDELQRRAGRRLGASGDGENAGHAERDGDGPGKNCGAAHETPFVDDRTRGTQTAAATSAVKLEAPLVVRRAGHASGVAPRPSASRAPRCAIPGRTASHSADARACSRRRRDGRLAPPGVALALVLALPGCGSSEAEERGPRRSAEATVRAWITTQDVPVRCQQAVTLRYVRATYGASRVAVAGRRRLPTPTRWRRACGRTSRRAGGAPEPTSSSWAATSTERTGRSRSSRRTGRGTSTPSGPACCARSTPVRAAPAPADRRRARGCSRRRLAGASTRGSRTTAPELSAPPGKATNRRRRTSSPERSRAA